MKLLSEYILILCSVSCIELKLVTNDEEGITQQIITLCISKLGIFFKFAALINCSFLRNLIEKMLKISINNTKCNWSVYAGHSTVRFEQEKIILTLKRYVHCCTPCFNSGNNLSELFIICYNFAVEKLAVEPICTPTTMQLMADSFPKIRYWILMGKNDNIGVIYRMYKILCTNPIETSISWAKN